VNKTGANRFLSSTVIDLSPDPPLITPQVFASLAGFFIGRSENNLATKKAAQGPCLGHFVSRILAIGLS
jgi:hypothetical protein